MKLISRFSSTQTPNFNHYLCETQACRHDDILQMVNGLF